ncbi:MAG: hypothetical protein MUP81_05765, partial [Dehalococcoidia bacterium]|nr:hypothetical protein [Dehalococcoidia bacterium]
LAPFPPTRGMSTLVTSSNQTIVLVSCCIPLLVVQIVSVVVLYQKIVTLKIGEHRLQLSPQTTSG